MLFIPGSRTRSLVALSLTAAGFYRCDLVISKGNRTSTTAIFIEVVSTGTVLGVTIVRVTPQRSWIAASGEELRLLAVVNSSGILTNADPSFAWSLRTGDRAVSLSDVTVAPLGRNQAALLVNSVMPAYEGSIVVEVDVILAGIGGRASVVLPVRHRPTPGELDPTPDTVVSSFSQLALHAANWAISPFSAVGTQLLYQFFYESLLFGGYRIPLTLAPSPISTAFVTVPAVSGDQQVRFIVVVSEPGEAPSAEASCTVSVQSVLVTQADINTSVSQLESAVSTGDLSATLVAATLLTTYNNIAVDQGLYAAPGPSVATVLGAVLTVLNQTSSISTTSSTWRALTGLLSAFSTDIRATVKKSPQSADQLLPLLLQAVNDLLEDPSLFYGSPESLVSALQNLLQVLSDALSALATRFPRTDQADSLTAIPLWLPSGGGGNYQTLPPLGSELLGSTLTALQRFPMALRQARLLPGDSACATSTELDVCITRLSTTDTKGRSIYSVGTNPFIFELPTGWPAPLGEISEKVVDLETWAMRLNPYWWTAATLSRVASAQFWAPNDTKLAWKTNQNKINITLAFPGGVDSAQPLACLYRSSSDTVWRRDGTSFGGRSSSAASCLTTHLTDFMLVYENFPPPIVPPPIPGSFCLLCLILGLWGGYLLVVCIGYLVLLVAHPLKWGWWWWGGAVIKKPGVAGRVLRAVRHHHLWLAWLFCQPHQTLLQGWTSLFAAIMAALAAPPLQSISPESVASLAPSAVWSAAVIWAGAALLQLLHQLARPRSSNRHLYLVEVIPSPPSPPDSLPTDVQTDLEEAQDAQPLAEPPPLPSPEELEKKATVEPHAVGDEPDFSTPAQRVDWDGAPAPQLVPPPPLPPLPPSPLASESPPEEETAKPQRPSFVPLLETRPVPPVLADNLLSDSPFALAYTRPVVQYRSVPDAILTARQQLERGNIILGLHILLLACPTNVSQAIRSCAGLLQVPVAELVRRLEHNEGNLPEWMRGMEAVQGGDFQRAIQWFALALHRAHPTHFPSAGIFDGLEVWAEYYARMLPRRAAYATRNSNDQPVATAAHRHSRVDFTASVPALPGVTNTDVAGSSPTRGAARLHRAELPQAPNRRYDATNLSDASAAWVTGLAGAQLQPHYHGMTAPLPAAPLAPPRPSQDDEGEVLDALDLWQRFVPIPDAGSDHEDGFTVPGTVTTTPGGEQPSPSKPRGTVIAFSTIDRAPATLHVKPGWKGKGTKETGAQPGSEENPFPDVITAVSAAMPGDTVNLLSGAYPATVLLGPPPGIEIVANNGVLFTGSRFALEISGARGLALRGIQLQGEVGLRLHDCRRVVVLDCVFRVGSHPMSLSGSSDTFAPLRNNTVVINHTGLFPFFLPAFSRWLGTLLVLAIAVGCSVYVWFRCRDVAYDPMTKLLSAWGVVLAIEFGLESIKVAALACLPTAVTTSHGVI
eukprot:TRINITY_DN21580_c0_g1_i1.p1 TRINITY_DN21580_c0_g1~~TRINITY_DN21580_c0_g1_i1.p1  ORF type:complete len:1446 (+),score=189.55 TRINITY_DN21580_c0_g1_i1:528-4865(+)